MNPLDIIKIVIVGDKEWVYAGQEQQGDPRYLLGTVGNKPLIIVGLNPSTAKPGKLDRTLSVVSRIARDCGYDSWLMLNLYPVRQTYQLDLSKKADVAMYQTNLDMLKAMLEKYPDAPVWLAWGGGIERRDYLKQAFLDMADMFRARHCVCYDKCTGAGHPHHPLYTKKNLPLKPFDIEGYKDRIAR